MTLSNPWGLLGLLSVPVILALHLLRERRHRYEVSSLSLWQFLEPEVRGSRFRKVPLTWLLVLDILIGIFLGLALARPKLHLSLPIHDSRHLIILIDTSASMLAGDVMPNRISRAKLEASELLNGLGPGDIATLVAFDSQARWIGDTRQDSLQDLLSRLTNQKAGRIGHALDDAIALGVSTADSKLPLEIHILSDGAFAYSPDRGKSYSVVWHKLSSDTNNQAILKISVLSMERDQLQVLAVARNFADTPVKRVVSLLVDGNPFDSTTLTLPPLSEVTQVWGLAGKPLFLTASLLGGDALREDDSASIGLTPSREVEVDLVRSGAQENVTDKEAANPILQALAALPEVDIHAIPVEEYSPVRSADMTIFQGVLPEELPDHPVLVVEPPLNETPAGIDPISIAEERDVPPDAPLQVDQSQSLMQDLDFSGVRWQKAFILERWPAGYTSLVQAGDIPLIIHKESGRSETIVVLADLKASNWTKHPAFPLFLGNLVQNLRKPSLPAALNLGESLSLPSPDSLQSLRIIPPEGAPIEFQGEWPSAWSGALSPGPYEVDLEEKTGRSTTNYIGINSGDAEESDLHPRAEITGQSGAPTAEEQSLERAIDLLPWLLSIVILLFFLEAVLAWH